MGDLETKGVKYWLLMGGLWLSFGILLSVAMKLMVVQGAYFKELARGNKVLETRIEAGRGKILDRKGRVVAESVYQYFKEVNGVKVFEEVGEFKGYKFEGTGLAYELKRQYPYGESMGDVTGYLGMVNLEDISEKKCDDKKIDAREMVGRGGIEEWMDCSLRGEAGRRLVEVDATGKYVRELGREEPVVGKEVHLTIDAYWQEKIYEMVKGKKVAVVMSEPKTGKIISLVSSPGFDPNHFSFQKNNEMITNYLNDKENYPLLNRAVGVRYHPGSVFKMVMATAGLEEKVVDKNTLFEDTGVLKVGDYSYANWLWTKSGSTDGMVDMVTALKRSNDIYFYKLGEALGVDRIKLWANKFGYGKKTGVELVGEVEGIVPDDAWKRKIKGERWYLGNTYHLSIGQGDLDVTPLQVNQMTNVMANEGKLCRMTILNDKKTECVSLGIKYENWKTVVEGMKAACNPGGTAWPLFNFKTEVACKTGTAEVGDGSSDTHAWLTAFAPADNPEISITVLVERGGEGSDVAAPIVGDILKEWFEEPETKVPRYDENGKVVM
jgi:penicillin-binding protein 2